MGAGVWDGCGIGTAVGDDGGAGWVPEGGAKMTFVVDGSPWACGIDGTADGTLVSCRGGGDVTRPGAACPVGAGEDRREGDLGGSNSSVGE